MCLAMSTALCQLPFDVRLSGWPIAGARMGLEGAEALGRYHQPNRRFG